MWSMVALPVQSAMVRVLSGVSGVTGLRSFTVKHGLVLGAVIAALGLSGCGRKGPLDLPPSAAVDAPAQNQPQQGNAQQGPGFTSFGSTQPREPESQRTAIGERAGVASDGRPIAPRGEKRRIPLDALID